MSGIPPVALLYQIFRVKDSLWIHIGNPIASITEAIKTNWPFNENEI